MMTKRTSESCQVHVALSSNNVTLDQLTRVQLSIDSNHFRHSKYTNGSRHHHLVHFHLHLHHHLHYSRYEQWKYEKLYFRKFTWKLHKQNALFHGNKIHLGIKLIVFRKRFFKNKTKKKKMFFKDKWTLQHRDKQKQNNNIKKWKFENK